MAEGPEPLGPTVAGRVGTLAVPARPRPAALVLAALAVLVLVAAGCGGDDGDAEAAGPVGYRRTPAPEVADLDFVDFAADPRGEPFSAVAPTDGFLLFYFGYLSCPDVCPLTLGELATTRAALPEDLAERTTVAMVTFDPERDEGREVADYMANFFAAGEYHGLRAADAETLDEAGERLSATWRREEEREDGSYFMAHSAQVYVIDEEGRAIWEFPYGSEPEAMADALVTLAADRT